MLLLVQSSTNFTDQSALIAFISKISFAVGLASLVADAGKRVIALCLNKWLGIF
jgi:hypothetical protein